MRLIDADAAIDVVHKWLENVLGISSTSYEVPVFKHLRALPTVDAVPVKHGKWTTKRTQKHDGEWYCTVCDYELNYCPNCGAKMDNTDVGRG